MSERGRCAVNYSKLETFLTLAECLSFSDAAEKLFCSQPSVSMQIQSLEEELKTKLFDRLGKKVYLTNQGEEFKPYAEKIVNLTNAAKEHLQQTDNLRHGTLSFGASHFVGVYLLPIILKQFNDRFPNVKIDMTVTSSKELIRQLEVNELELLILSDQILFDENVYSSTTFYNDELILVVPPEHPFAIKKAVQISDLQSELFLIKRDKSATRMFLENKLKAIEFSITHYIEISSLEGIKQGVIHGLGISFISKYAVKEEIKNGLLVEVPLEEIRLERGVNYIHHKTKNLSPAISEFISLLKNTLEST